MDCERMDAPLQLVRKRRIDHAVALDPALPMEGFRHDINPEMSFAALTMSGMTLVAVGLVLDLETERREGLGELLRNGCPDTHELNGAFTIPSSALRTAHATKERKSAEHVLGVLSSLRVSTNPPHNGP